MEQLLYLAQGESYLNELDITLDEERPPSPACISHDQWQTLHKIPLSTEYFSVVVKSIHDNPDFWESLSASSKDVAESSDLLPFPWKQADSSPPTSGLDEYVLLKCLHSQSVSDKLVGLANKLVASIEVPELREIIQADSLHPLLLLHDRACPVSQANEMELENELRKCLTVNESVAKLVNPTFFGSLTYYVTLA